MPEGLKYTSPGCKPWVTGCCVLGTRFQIPGFRITQIPSALKGRDINSTY